MPTQKDTILDLIKTESALTVSQKVIVQWNNNAYKQPDAYGFFARSGDYEYLSSDEIAVNITSGNLASVKSMTGLGSLNTSNVVRVTFDAAITGTPTGGYSGDYENVMIQMTPVYSGSAQDANIDMTVIDLQDNVYNKYEIFVLSNDNNKFDQINMSVKSCNQGYSGNLNVTFKNICVTHVPEEEILEEQADRLSGVFKPNRPGDQLLENNQIIPTGATSASQYSIVSQYYVAISGFTDRTVGDGVNLISTALSPFNEFKYFISPSAKTIYGVFASYNSPVKTNEIYVKTQNIKSPDMLEGYITSASVYLKESGVWGSPVAVSSASILDRGSFILRWNGSAWTTDEISYPQINKDTAALSSIKQIEGVMVKVALARNSYSPNDDHLRLRMIELSPRLTVDLSNFMIRTNFKSNIDEGNYAVPVGLASSNNGSVELENLPRISGADRYQIFSNNAYSPLAGYIYPDAKFTIYSTVTDTKTGASSASVKTATMFATSWSGSEYESVNVELSDYGRYLQSMPSPEILLTTQHTTIYCGSIQKIVETLLQSAGFSDYSRTSLREISDRLLLGRGYRPSIFFSNSTTTVWETMREILLPWQISYYFDKDGILQFRDIIREQKSSTYSDGTTYFNLCDTEYNSFIPNIISIEDMNKEYVGSISTRYRPLSFSSQLNTSLDGSRLANSLAAPQFRQQGPTPTQVPWAGSQNSQLDCANLEATVSATDTRIRVGTSRWQGEYSTAGLAASVVATLKPVRSVANFNGYGILEGEIISWDGLEYSFSPVVSGFSSTQVIKSSDELVEAVTSRIGTQNTYNVTNFSSASATKVVTLTLSSVPPFRVGDTIYVNIPGMVSSNVTVRSSASNVVTYIDDGAVQRSSTAVDGSVYYTVFNVTYNPTGYICNVERGLFGTKAAEHLYGNIYSASYIFIGNGTRMPLNSRFTRTNNELAIPLPQGTTTTNFKYAGFYNKDDNRYTKYVFSVRSNKDLNLFGIFLGASTSVSANNVTLRPVTDRFANGMYIQLYSTRAGAGISGLVRGAYTIHDVVLKDTYVIERKKRGSEYVWVVKQQSSYNTVEIYINNNNRTLSMKVNGKLAKFKAPRSSRKLNSISIERLTRSGRSFGVYGNGKYANNLLKLVNIQAIGPGQTADSDTSFAESGHSSSNLDLLLSERRNIPRTSTAIPFSIRSLPILKGITVYDVKFNNNVPFFAYQASEPQGLVAYNTINPKDINKSATIGTPFRARVAYANNSSEVAYTVANSGEFQSARIDGMSIVIGSEKTKTTVVSKQPGAQNIDISAPWCNNGRIAERINADLVKNLVAMNKVYSLSLFGNPAIEPGDYVYLRHFHKGTSGYFIVSSVDQTFDGGGFDTTVQLRSVNVSS